jgi:hypothetical protein
MAKTTDLDVGYVSKLARLTCALSVNWSASPLGKGERITRRAVARRRRKVRGSTQRADDRAKPLTLPSPLRRERGNRETDTRPCTRGYSTYIFDNG